MYDGLVGFRRVPGPAGLDMVPDLADAVPQPTEGGRLYTFHIRPGVRFADGAPVRPSDAAASFRRIFRIVGPTAGSFYGGIEGAADCLRSPPPARCPASPPTTRPARSPSASPGPTPTSCSSSRSRTPASCPPRAPGHDAGTDPLPGTGPYRFTRYDPATGLRLERNPLFHPWNPDAQPTAARTRSNTASAWRTRRR